MTMSDTFLVGRREGGKTTFIGGLRQFLVRSGNNDSLLYPKIPAKEGEKNYFYQNVIKRMKAGHYPESTEKPYLVECSIHPDAIDKPYWTSIFPFWESGEENVVLCDLPGEEQDDLQVDLHNNFENIYNSKNTIVDDFNEKFEPNLGSSVPWHKTDKERWEIAFKYYLLTSSKLIFLVNLYNFTEEGNPDSPPLIDPNIFDSKIIQNKDRVAIIITACDIIGHEPEAEISNPSFAHAILGEGNEFTVWDQSLYNKMIDQSDSDLNEKPRITESLKKAKKMQNVDLFGVSVPATSETDDENGTIDGNETNQELDPENINEEDAQEADQSNRIQMEDGNVVLNGFEVVVRWLLQA